MEKGETQKHNLMCKSRRAGEQEGWQVSRGKQEVSRSQQTGETDRKTDWEAGGPRGSSFSTRGLEELPEMQVDPILGHQHNSWSGDRDPEGIWSQLKEEQDQGHHHLHILHGKVLPDAVPGSGREKETREASKPRQEQSLQGQPAWAQPGSPSLRTHAHLYPKPCFVNILPLTSDKSLHSSGLAPPLTSALSKPETLLQEGQHFEPQSQVK